MNKFTRALMATLLLGASALSQANTTYSAEFELEGRWLPSLRTGSPVWDGPHSLPGAWMGNDRRNAVANSRDLLSSNINPGTGVLEHTWGQQNHSDNRHSSGGPLLSMGESFAHIPGPNDWSRAIVQSAVQWSSLSARVELHDKPAQADAGATWTRDFSLDAHSSFTFSGLATLDIVGDANPLATGTTFDQNGSFALLTMADLFGRVKTSIGANLWGIGTGLGDFFSYSVGPNGLLSLTITNHTSSALQGTVNAGTYVAVSPPVPEPETWLLLLAGAGLVGARVRHRRLVAAV